ncbi:sialin-like [Asterias rubens]|uniref:sialin-like n=1 Tax=Asterias rubens TaxID=7604 RepID=UPI0014558079|nr:sialin-like [Asterias rubens]XP_033640469.1 sialin-like [Asterias rubens]XP_033640470.1 sialin-like [Asterias rubens]
MEEPIDVHVASDVTDEDASLIKPNANQNSTIAVPKVPGLISARYTLAILSFLGLMNIYAMRVNLSVALVAMVNTTLTNHSSVCPTANMSHTPKNGEFNWDESTQGQILGSFFYGYVFTQIPGGLLADRYGAKLIFGLGVLCTAVLTLATPFAARAGYQYLIALRVLEGVGEGVTYPAMHSLWGHWAPPLERSRLVTITYSGSHMGTVLAMPISGLLSELNFLDGWPLAFYVFGTSALIWFVLWMLLVHDKPSKHPRISDVERIYIESSIGDKDGVYSVPWWSMMTSTPVWALVITFFCSTWGFYTLLTNLPTYLKVVLGFDLSQSGFLAAVPYLALWCVMITSGHIADFLISHQIFSTTTTRKIFTALGLTLPGTFLVFTSYVGCDHTIAMTLLTLSVTSSGLNGSGISVNHLDIAPKYAGLLMGISNMVGSIPGFLGPVVAGVLTEDMETFQRWSVIFWISFGTYLLGTMVYVCLGSAEKQPWAMDSQESSAITHQDINPSVQNDAGIINA